MGKPAWIPFAMAVCLVPLTADVGMAGDKVAVHPLVVAGNHTHENHSGDDHSNAIIQEINFSDANLSNTNFTGANISSGAFFSGADLTGADLTNANCNDATFDFADLSNATLTNTAMAGAFFFMANLTGADLSGASLGTAEFTSANLTNATFSNGTLISGADFSRVNFTNAVGLGDADGSGGVFYSLSTDFTGTGFDPVAAGWLLLDTPIEIVIEIKNGVPRWAVKFPPGGPKFDVEYNFKNSTGQPGVVKMKVTAPSNTVVLTEEIANGATGTKTYISDLRGPYKHCITYIPPEGNLLSEEVPADACVVFYIGAEVPALSVHGIVLFVLLTAMAGGTLAVRRRRRAIH